MSDEGEAGVAAGDGMTDAIGFARVKEEDLVGFGDGLVLADVADLGSTIGEDERGDARLFFSTAISVGAAAVDVSDRDAGGVEEEVGGDLGGGGRHAAS